MNRFLFCVVFMMGCFVSSALAQGSLAIDETDRVQLPRTARLTVPPGSDLGRTNPNLRMQRMSVVLACSQRQSAQAIPVKADQHPVWPGSLNSITQQDCHVRLPELKQDLPVVTSWLRSHGFAIEPIRGQHFAIRFSGTVAQVEEAFRVEIHTYLVNGQTYYYNTTNLSIPRRISRLVLRVNALDSPVVNQSVSSSSYAVVHSFTGTAYAPEYLAAIDKAGNFYGATAGGGSTGLGSIFRLDSAGHEMVLYSFTGTNGDGAYPAAGVIMDSAGNLYGTTESGGVTSPSSCSGPPPAGCGTVFKLDPSGHETVLYSFTGTNGDGANPVAGLIIDSAGNLYGTTENGGQCVSGCGTVFKLDPSGHETVLYSFTHSFNSMNGDGADPLAGVIMDSAGNLYGTTNKGGSSTQCGNGFDSFGCGTVFKLDPSGKETVLHSFTATNGDGVHPAASLIMDGAGNLYGTTEEGGGAQCNGAPFGCGTVFKLDPSGMETVLYSFTGTNGDGVTPAASLIMDGAGNLYGTTEEGGSAQCSDTYGRFGCGMVFKLDPSGKETVLYSFTGTNGDGINPAASLIRDDAGNLFGTTLVGGSAGGGTVFKLDLSGKEMVLYSFPFSNGDGATPAAGLMMDSAGNLYGTTPTGGSAQCGDAFRPFGCGTVFKLDPSGKETVLYSFLGTNGDGANPAAGVIMDSAGNLYGTTEYGGVSSSGSCSGPPPVGCGTVFKLDPSGKETVLYSFTGTNGDGVNPASSLIMDGAGNLYGTTLVGGVNPGNCPPSFDLGGSSPPGCGTVFKLDPSGHETVLYRFTLTNGDGAQPVAGLIMDSAGNLYGTTVLGGVTSSSCIVFVTGPPPTPGCGTVFKLDPSGKETVLYSFTGTNGDGAYPAAVVMDSAGNLYGTTESGGVTSPSSCSGPPPAGCGTVFKLDPSGKETVLYSFTGTNGDGADPVAGVIMDSVGNLYGTTAAGGATAGGTVFKVDPSGHETVLYSFTGTNGDGEDPVAGVIMDSASNLYGTTEEGGSAHCGGVNNPFGCGTVFRLEVSDFSLGAGSGGSTSTTVTAGQTATYNLQLNPAGGFSGSVSLACSGSPAQTICSVSPASATVSGPSAVPFTVTVTTTAPTVMVSSVTGSFDSALHGQTYTFLFACALFAVIALGARRAGRDLAWAPIGSVVCLTIALVACGGSDTGGKSGGGTPVGTYNLTVTGTSQKVSHTLALTLNVK